MSIIQMDLQVLAEDIKVEFILRSPVPCHWWSFKCIVSQILHNISNGTWSDDLFALKMQEPFGSTWFRHKYICATYGVAQIYSTCIIHAEC